MFNGPLGFFIFVALTTFLFGSAPSHVPLSLALGEFLFTEISLYVTKPYIPHEFLFPEISPISIEELSSDK